MLILSRSVGQSLIIGEEYEITLSRTNLRAAWVSIAETASPSNSKMLKLWLGESTEVSPTIRIAIVDLDRRKVRFGLQLPKSMPVYRKEDVPPVDRT